VTTQTGEIQLISEDRLVDLEIRITRHEDLLDALNQTIYRQQKQIDQLEKLCLALKDHIRDMSSATGEQRNAASEKPPHY
jgi:SlyX protein